MEVEVEGSDVEGMEVLVVGMGMADGVPVKLGDEFFAAFLFALSFLILNLDSSLNFLRLYLLHPFR